MLPLNGTKTHPLSAHALQRLKEMARQPIPVQDVNPGVVNRLQREELVTIVSLPSEFKTHKGKNIPYLQITEAGRAKISN